MPRRFRSSLVAIALVINLCASVSAKCDEPKTTPVFVDPALFGFKIPPAIPVVPRQDTVLVSDESEKQVVAKVHVELGDYRLVIMPDGSIAARPTAECIQTDKPFRAVSTDELAKRVQIRFPNFKVKTTRRYVCVYNSSEEFAVVTLRVLDTMLTGMKKFMDSQKVAVRDPDVPLLAIIFRTPEEFQRFERTAAGVVAFYSPATNYVVMYEESPLYQLKRELAIQESLSTIAHEGAHQILHNIGVQQRLSIWPMWVNEGLAEYFAPTNVSRRLQWKGAGQVNDLRMLDLELFLQGHGRTANGRLVTDTVSAARLSATGYATAWSLTHYLAKNERSEFFQYINELSELKPLTGHLKVRSGGLIAENLAQFYQHFGEEPDALAIRVVDHLKKLPYKDPFAELPHFVAVVSYGNGKSIRRDANVFHVRNTAEKWAQAIVGELDDDLQKSASISIETFANRSAAAAYAKQSLRKK